MKMHPDWNDAPAPLLAVLIHAGYATEWPHEWTRDGKRALRRHSDVSDVIREAAHWIDYMSPERQWPFELRGFWFEVLSFHPEKL